MTVSSETSKVTYLGDGSTVVFAVPFYFLASNEVKVVHTDGAGVETTWMAGTHYEIAGAGSPSGGTITVKTTPTDYTPDSGDRLIIKRDLDLVQETDYPEGGQFPASAHEQALDRLVMLCQQLNEEISRTLKLAESSSLSDLLVPDPEAGKALIWNSEEDGLENSQSSVVDLDAAVSNTQSAATAAATSASGAASSATLATTKATEASASAAAAQGYAAQAATTLASALWRDVVYLSAADSPRAITVADNGKLLVCDTSAGAIVVNLATIASLGEPFNVSVKWEAGPNAVTINRAGTDTIDGATSHVFEEPGAVILVAEASTSPDQWETVEIGATTAITFDTLPGRAKTAARLSLFNLAR
jgi:hypothetical protein